MRIEKFFSGVHVVHINLSMSFHLAAMTNARAKRAVQPLFILNMQICDFLIAIVASS